MQLQFNRTVQKVIENLTREQCRYLVRVTKADRLADLRGRVAAKFNAGELNISEIDYAFSQLTDCLASAGHLFIETQNIQTQRRGTEIKREFR